MLTVSPLAKGLFHQSSSHSGPCIGSWGPGPQPDGFALSARLMKKLRAPTIDAMRRVNASDLVWPDFGEIANMVVAGECLVWSQMFFYIPMGYNRIQAY